MYDLVEFRATRHSQFGEGGIIAKVFETIGERNRWCVEFGAWDGLYLSNTASLLEHGWAGVLIEGDRRRFADLRRNWGARSDVITLNRRIGITENTLEAALLETGTPEEFDFLSIDVDGDDYYLWESLRRLRPRVVVIEANFSFPFNVEFVQRPGSRTRIGSSALSLYYLGLAKGYELVCYNVINCFFVRRELAERFALRDRSFAYLFHRGLEHHLGAATSQEGKLYLLGDAVYGTRRNPFAKAATWWIRGERELRRLAARFRIVRAEEYQMLFDEQQRPRPIDSST